MTAGDNNPPDMADISVREALGGLDRKLFESYVAGTTHSFSIRSYNGMPVLELTINTAHQGMLDDDTLDAVTRQLDKASAQAGIVIAVNDKPALKIYYLIDLSSHLDSSFEAMLDDLDGVRESITATVMSKDFKIHHLI